ncbi:hypothetical protein [Dactylosporangium salmoneum]|uniref:Uncharacterized protein n=1 Tax=Dactylosporangium salmoneum TaxID=53361 RepID=A0ABP5UES8_9ACTN
MSGPDVAAGAAVSFPVWDAVVDLPGSPQWRSSIVHDRVVVAVSRVRGASPDEPDARADEAGVTVWSFSVDGLCGDPWWPVRHASLVFATRLAEHAGMSLRDATLALVRIVESDGIAVDPDVDGRAEQGRLFEVRELGWLVSSVQPVHAFAASCYLVPPVVHYRLVER